MAFPSVTRAGMAFLLLLPLACSSHRSVPPPVTPPASVLVGGSVAISGLMNNGQGYEEALLWRDGTAAPLVNDSSLFAAVYAMAVQGTDVYAVGWDSTFPNRAALWKNGVATNLTDPADVLYSVDVLTAIAVTGTDVYVAGYTENSPFTVATYWKNGVPVPLGTNASTLSAIVVQGSDVYVAGASGGAKYWKNGVAHGLGSMSGAASANALAVTPAGEVLVAGTVIINDVQCAVLWRDALPAIWSDGLTWADAYGIAISGDDVYVAGDVASGGYSQAAVWKNGVITFLPSKSGSSAALAISLDGSDVYVAGWDELEAVYWKNGQEVPLTQGNVMAAATAICVLHP